MSDPFARETTAGMLLLGRYQVRRELGRGGFGVVVEAFDVSVKRLVAIKTLHPPTPGGDYEQYAYQRERFSYEAEAMAAIGVHPQIVTFFTDIVDAEQVRYLILEYLPGGSLDKRITQEVGRRLEEARRDDPSRTLADVTQGLDIADALRITADAARGLQAAHDAYIVHRDIKPQNIFLAANGRAKVGDFGIAQIGDRSGRSRLIFGHPESLLYMSPEQQQAALGYLRSASDQYSLGLTLFVMLTGREYRRIGEREAARLLAPLPAPVVTLFEHTTQLHPDERYPDMASVVRAIAAIEMGMAPRSAPHPLPVDHGADGSDHPKAPMPPGSIDDPYPPTPVPTPIRRRAVLLGAGGVVLLGAVGGGIALVNHNQEPVTIIPTPGPTSPTRTATFSAITPAPTAGPTVGVTPSPTNPPPIATRSYTSPSGAFQLRYPQAWTMGTGSNNAISFSPEPAGSMTVVGFLIAPITNPTVTPEQDLRMGLQPNPSSSVTFAPTGPIVSITIGGEPGFRAPVYVTFFSMPTPSSTGTASHPGTATRTAGLTSYRVASSPHRTRA